MVLMVLLLMLILRQKEVSQTVLLKLAPVLLLLQLVVAPMVYLQT